MNKKIATTLNLLLLATVVTYSCKGQSSATTRTAVTLGGTTQTLSIHDVNLLDGHGSVFSLSADSKVAGSRLVMLGYGTPESIGKEPLTWHSYLYPGANPMISSTYLSNHRDLSTVRCSTNGSGTYRQIFSGSGQSSRILTSSFFGALFPTKERFGAGYRYQLDQSSAIVFLDDQFNVIRSTYLNTADEGSNVVAFCSHKLSVEPIGWEQSHPLNTIHSYFIVGNGLLKPVTTEAPDPNETVSCGVVYGEARHKTWTSSIIPQQQNAMIYYIVDQVGNESIRRSTRFFDAFIDIGRHGVETSPTRSAETMCTSWRGIIVGDKMPYDAAGQSALYGLVTYIDDAFVPVGGMTRIYEVSSADGRLETSFLSLTPARGPNDAIDGFIVGGHVSGLDSRFPNPDPNSTFYNAYACFFEFAGCNAISSVNQVFIRVPGFLSNSDNVEMSMTAIGEGMYAAVLRGWWMDEAFMSDMVYLIRRDGTSFECVGTYRATSDFALNLNDLVFAKGRLILVGSASDQRSIVIAPELEKSFQSCGLLQVPFEPVTLDVASYPRFLQHESAVIETLLVSRPTPIIAEQFCVSEETCSTSVAMNGKVDIWGSHYDRGHSVVFVNDNTLAHTGLVAGPYRAQNVCDEVECTPEMSQSTDARIQRNYDCDVIITDNKGDYTSANHGWYRLLPEPEEFYGRCDMDPVPMFKGTSAFEIGYGISNIDNTLVVVGKQVETRPLTSLPCPGPNGPIGDADAMINVVDDILTTAPSGRTFLFGKEHDDTDANLPNTNWIEKNFDLFAEQFSTNVIDGPAEYHAGDRSLEILYGVTMQPAASLSSELITCAVGVTTALDYDVSGAPPTYTVDQAQVSTPIRKGLLIGTAPFVNKTSCEDIDRLWAGTLSSTRTLDKHTYLQDVASMNAIGSPSFIAVGGTQSQRCRYSPGDPDANIWWSGVPSGSGIVIVSNEHGAITRAARVSMVNADCDQSTGSAAVGMVRLTSVTVVDSDGNDTKDMIVVAGGCIPLGTNSNEYAFIMALGMDLKTKWFQILRPSPKPGPLFSATFRDVNLDSDGNIVAVGFGERLHATAGTEDDGIHATFTMSGNMVRSGILMKMNSQCDLPGLYQDNHFESVSSNSDRTYVVGSTCRYRQPPAFGLNGDGCHACVQEKGQRLGLLWDCPININHALAMELTSIGLNELALFRANGTSESVLLRIDVQASTELNDLALSYQLVQSPCTFVRLLNLEIVKEADDTECPNTSDIQNSYEVGTVQAKATIYPSPCWPTP